VKTLSVATRSRQEIQDVTGEVERAVAASGVVSGLCHLYVPHTTAGIAINENADPDVKRDILLALDKLVPDDPEFRHGEGNSCAHIKSILTGCSQTLLVEDGSLELGSWGGVYFCEFDGPRRRKLLVRCQGAGANGSPLID
jgi:secondary thiamine-phosphate synthase enzyme